MLIASLNYNYHLFYGHNTNSQEDLLFPTVPENMIICSEVTTDTEPANVCFSNYTNFIKVQV